MKAFKAEIYQLDKEGNKNSNCYHQTLTDAIANDKNITGKNIGEYFATKLFKVFNAQNSIVNKGGKKRFYGLAISKPLYFHLEVEKQVVFSSSLTESITCKSIKLADATPESVSTAIQTLYDIVNDDTKLA